MLFNPAERPLAHGVVVLAVFAFTLVATLAITARRPILAAATTFAGAAWPVTLVPEGASTLRGVLILAAALLLLAALRPGRSPRSSQALLVGAPRSFRGAPFAVGSSVAKGGFLDWQQWEHAREDKAVSVQYVWDSDYDGIEFPKNSTTVFTVEADRRTPYWQATTLDVFLDDNWRRTRRSSNRCEGRPRFAHQRSVASEGPRRRELLRQKSRSRSPGLASRGRKRPRRMHEEGRGGEYGSGIAYVGRLERGGTRSGATPHNRRLLSSRAHGPTIRKRSCPTARS